MGETELVTAARISQIIAALMEDRDAEAPGGNDFFDAEIATLRSLEPHTYEIDTDLDFGYIGDSHDPESLILALPPLHLFLLLDDYYGG